MLTPVGNFPAGYECSTAYQLVDGIVTSVWLVPDGDPVYCHAALTDPNEVTTDEFWERTVKRVQQHVRNRVLGLQSFTNGVSTYRGMALSNRPPTPTGDTHVQATTQPASPSLTGRRNASGDFDLHPTGDPGSRTIND